MERPNYFNPANLLTYTRILSVPFLVWIMTWLDDTRRVHVTANMVSSIVATVVFTFAGFSDLLDGWIARKYGTVSTYGKFIDPLADKILLLGVTVMMVPIGRLPAWLVVVILAREITITTLRAIAAAEGIIIAASQWGKRKAAFQSVALGALLLHYPFLKINFHLIGWIVLWISVVFSLGSAGHYTYCFFREAMDKGRAPSN